jgi:hypothetical protein
VETESIRSDSGSTEDRARRLYYRYGASPWPDLPEMTRSHFRQLVRDGLDGAGQPLAD